jgi:CBS domain-containing membrane protein
VPWRSRPLRLFYPILAGATLKDRAIASIGAVVCLVVTALICARSPFGRADLPVIIAPIGASAVLLLAVPASPLAQPWSILGGNVASALVGVVVAQVLGHTPLALAVAVGAAILVMSLLRCLHPPGGAIAMTAVVGGASVWDAGFAFPFAVVAVDSIVLIAAGVLFHRFSGHSYPHRPKPLATEDHLHRADISQALADVGEAFDVSEEDLEILLERAEHYARLRAAPTSAKSGKRT